MKHTGNGDDDWLCMPCEDAEGRKIYPLHESCWNILEQAHTTITGCETRISIEDVTMRLEAHPCGIDDAPSWIASGGWVISGYWNLEGGWMETMHHEFGHSDDTRQLDYLAQDPACVPEILDAASAAIDAAAATRSQQQQQIPTGEPCASTPPPAATLTSPGNITTTTITAAEAPGEKRDCFAKLPAEICTELLCLLPTEAALKLRLASRTMANTPLSATWCKSRFLYPYELSHLGTPATIEKLLLPTQINWQVLTRELVCLPHPPIPPIPIHSSHSCVGYGVLAGR